MALVTATSLVLAQVGAGHIQGGWEYIGAAYAIAWTALALYGLSLWLRRPGKAVNDSRSEP
jgi:hypothetical protein